eukprot:4082009-Pleurochrysis_carterae.AAC.1
MSASNPAKRKATLIGQQSMSPKKQAKPGSNAEHKGMDARKAAAEVDVAFSTECPLIRAPPGERRWAHIGISAAMPLCLWVHRTRMLGSGHGGAETRPPVTTLHIRRKHFMSAEFIWVPKGFRAVCTLKLDGDGSHRQFDADSQTGQREMPWTNIAYAALTW